MLNRLPRHTPDLHQILAEIGRPSAADVAQALGVSRRTVERWKRNGAPRIALLALWWLSQEGHSTWDAEMHNRTNLALGTAEALRAEVARLRQAQGLDGAGTAWRVGRPGRAANDATGRRAEGSRWLRHALQGSAPDPAGGVAGEA